MSATPPPHPLFTPQPSEVGAFVESERLGLVISHGPPAHVTPLPLLATLDAEGGVRAFFGHFGGANPQIEALKSEPRALIIFMGPHSYIPTAWIGTRRWAPTWNYALAYFEVEIVFDATENERALSELVETMERGAWTPAEMGERYAVLSKRVLAFRARVLRPVGKFKLGQDETPEIFQQILDGLGPSPLAELMRKARRD